MRLLTELQFCPTSSKRKLKATPWVFLFHFFLSGLKRSDTLTGKCFSQEKLCILACENMLHGSSPAGGAKRKHSRRCVGVFVSVFFDGLSRSAHPVGKFSLAKTCSIACNAMSHGSSPAGGARKKALAKSQVLFSMKRTFRCMKNEAGLRPMKRAFGIWKSRVRFASYEHRERIMATKLPLHICFANLQFFKFSF